MIEDFVLPASPSAARRLSYLATVAPIDLDEETRALAAEGLLGDADFASLPSERFTPEQRAATQALLDVALRGLLLCGSPYLGRALARDCVLAAARFSDTWPLIVATNDLHVWTTHAQGWGLKATYDVYDEEADVLVVPAIGLTEQPVLARRRHGALVLDCLQTRFHSMHEHAGPAREVAKTLIISDLTHDLSAANGKWNSACDRHVVAALAMLFSSRAADIIESIGHQEAGIVSKLRERGFTRLRPADLYPLFNVVSDLLGVGKPQ